MCIHRCPATVSGTKSAEATAVLGLGKVQRVESRREPGTLPYRVLRCPFEGEERQRVLPTLTVSSRSFLSCAASLSVRNCTPSSRVEEEWGRGSKP